MKKLAWSTGFVIVAVVAGADSACTVTIDNGDGGATILGDDAATQVETGTAETDAAETGTVEASTLPDTGTTPAEAAVDDGGSCPIGAATGSDACDACIDSSCCDALVACDSGAASNNTPSECEDIASCYGDCLFPPADSGVTQGTPTECGPLCSNNHSPQSITAFQNLQTCIATNCSTPCQ